MKLILLLLLLVAVATAQAQSFSISGSAIRAGGGTSRGGDFTVSGTVGEPLTSATSGGAFTVATGFWSVVATVPTPDAPTLFIESRPDGSIVLLWPSTPRGFILEANRDLDSADWAAAPYSVSDDGTWKSVRLPAPLGMQFFRLSH